MILGASLLAAAASDWAVVTLVAVIGVACGPALLGLARRLCLEPLPGLLDRRSIGLAAGSIMAVGGVLLSFGGLALPSALALGAGLALVIVVSMVDAAEHRIPNRLTYPAIGGCLISATVAVLGASDRVGASTPAISALVGGLVFALLLLVPHVVRPDAMGMGDVKLAFPLGFAIGWVRADALEVIIALGWTLAAASAFGLIGAVSLHRRSVPFGPALSAATVLTVTLLV